MSGQGRTLVLGGGIGGLTLSAALAQGGTRVAVLERGNFTEESGAGIQLGANAVRRLKALGAMDLLEPHAARPEALWIYDALSGRRLGELPLGAAYEQRYGAPYLALHRADLHRALLELCGTAEGILRVSGFEAAEISDDGRAATVKNAKGLSFSGERLVGADGLWSEARRYISPDARLQFAGRTASRAMLPIGDAPAPFDAPVVTLWLAPGAHLVTYPVRAGELLNIVLVTEGGAAHQGWNEISYPTEILRKTWAWRDAPRALMAGVEFWRSWSLFGLKGLDRWSRGGVVLLGDAAHPVQPFLAQGAALAIEDAVALAEALHGESDNAKAFRSYERARRRRAQRVARTSARLGLTYHLGDPWRRFRDAVLRRRQPEAALRSFDWLYRG